MEVRSVHDGRYHNAAEPTVGSFGLEDSVEEAANSEKGGPWDFEGKKYVNT